MATLTTVGRFSSHLEMEVLTRPCAFCLVSIWLMNNTRANPDRGNFLPGENMRFRIVICILLAAFAVAPQTGLAADSSTPVSLEEFLKRLGYGSVPFKSDAHNRLRVDADLGNGKKRILFVDTGWRVTMLNEKSARGLKTLGELGVDLKDPYLGQVTNSSFVLVEKLMLGRAQFANQPARVGKHRMDYTQLPFDGVLGVDFLLRNFCLIDLSARRLYFRGSEPSP